MIVTIPGSLQERMLREMVAKLSISAGIARATGLDDVRAMSDWRGWLTSCFPSYFTAPFAPHHEDFWEHVWAIKPEVRPRPVISVLARGGGKSSSTEAATIALGVHGQRKYALYLCHAKGTEICDPILGWMQVEEHPTATAMRYEEGILVSLATLPFLENVTHEHRYWARRVARRDLGHGRGCEILRGRPHWIEAQHLDWNTWLGYPISTRVEVPRVAVKKWNRKGYYDSEIPPEFFDPEWWWVFGLWWGDGTLTGERKSQISFAISDANTADRLAAIVTRYGYRLGKFASKGFCHYYFSASHLARWLQTWRQGRNSRKCPPPWVEHLPYEYQQALIRGYCDADGYVDKRAVILTSIHLPGLLAVRRIISRLGILCSIGRASVAREATIEGRTYHVQASYTLRLTSGVSQLGFSVEEPHRDYVRDTFIDDGHLWVRVRNIEASGPQVYVPITTKTGTYETAFGLSHNCSSQAQADQHVESIGATLESSAFASQYPHFANRRVGKYGHSRGWRRNRLRTEAGFTIDAAGLDKGVRGMKEEGQRPDVIVFDDLDSVLDSAETVRRKIVILTQSILPAGSQDVAILGVQNLIHPDSIFSRLVDGRADFLADRIVIGPVPAVEGLTYEERDGKYWITGGRPTWVGQNLDACQAQMHDDGLTSFLIERQHEIERNEDGIYGHIVWQHCAWSDVPPLERVVVWVDPAVTNTDQSDSHGIQADGLATDGKLYRLFSWEGRTSPEDALSRAILKAVELKAACVGVETDQGGDTWQSTYREAIRKLQISEPPPFRSAKAGAGHGPKAHRQAQMISAYERGMIVHVRGTHEPLERALKRFGIRKPYDLADAAYWSWYDLCGRRSKWLPVGT